MKTIEEHIINKSKYPDGPWKAEPDKRQWQDPTTGLPCLIVRNRMGNLCGYVGVSKGHPAFETSFNDVEHIYAHGGLTFSNFCAPVQRHIEANGDESPAVCHVVEDGEDEHVWWFGFDTCHPPEDLLVQSFKIMEDAGFPPEGEYRDMAYVTKEVTDLAAQLAAMGARAY